jgi:hypothetical protein
MMNEIEKKLRAFFLSKQRNAWVETDQISVYLRKASHISANGELRHYLDIANVTVDLAFRRQGVFKAFLALCQQIQPYGGILVENVHSEVLRAYLCRLTQQDARWRGRGQHFLWEKSE